MAQSIGLPFEKNLQKVKELVRNTKVEEFKARTDIKIDLGNKEENKEEPQESEEDHKVIASLVENLSATPLPID